MFDEPVVITGSPAKSNAIRLSIDSHLAAIKLS